MANRNTSNQVKLTLKEQAVLSELQKIVYTTEVINENLVQCLELLDNINLSGIQVGKAVEDSAPLGFAELSINTSAALKSLIEHLSGIA